jgi:hypothetical protein
VQFLRNFRDQQILHTFAGSSFMLAFNAWYYSFSPTVAHYIAMHDIVKPVMRVALYPLIIILKIGADMFQALGDQEIGAVTSGFVVSALLGVAYLGVPTYALKKFALRNRKVATRLMKGAVVILAASLTLIFVAESLNSLWLMMLSSSAFTLSALTAFAFGAAEILNNVVERR